LLWKDNLTRQNSDDQQFHQYQQNEQLPLILDHWRRKRSQNMQLEIQVLAWNSYNNVAGLNQYWKQFNQTLFMKITCISLLNLVKGDKKSILWRFKISIFQIAIAKNNPQNFKTCYKIHVSYKLTWHMLSLVKLARIHQDHFCCWHILTVYHL
jgi:hypothetical protein